MEKIKLLSGKTVDLSISAGSIELVKNQLKVSLVDLGSTGVIEKMMDDPLLLCNIIYLLCKRSCEEQKISAEDFAYGMEGEQIEAATKAFIEELINFLPPSKKTLLRQSLKMQETLNQKMVESSMAKMESLMGKMETMVDRELDKTMLKIEETLTT